MNDMSAVSNCLLFMVGKRPLVLLGTLNHSYPSVDSNSGLIFNR